QEIVRDRMDPGGEFPVRIVRLTRAVDAQEGVLRQILDALLIVEALAQETLNARLVALDEELETTLIAIGIALEQLFVGELGHPDGRRDLETRRRSQSGSRQRRVRLTTVCGSLHAPNI